ncbi:MAG: hypothetical protein HKL95_03930 [Phycisphaerae bacterium]|nr:hypothetical protein [Phycisphaerae bacterium]
MMMHQQLSLFEPVMVAVAKRPVRARKPTAQTPKKFPPPVRGIPTNVTLRRQFFARIVEHEKKRYQISIRKWRSTMSGVAYELHYSNGQVKRMVAAPRPKSPVSCAIFLHEVGHHAIGFRKFRPRCLEEFHVWQWAFAEMGRWNIPIDQRVRHHYQRSMYHYVQLAKKRGLQHLPEILRQFQHGPTSAGPTT